MTDTREAMIAGATRRVGRYRWVIVGLLFTATVINYIDRQMIGLLKPTLMADPTLAMDERAYADIIVWFTIAYAAGYLVFGKVVDAIGARLGYAAAVVIWTIAHVAHGGAYTVAQFAIARFGLGVGESGNFPAGVKSVANWFPQRERAFAIGIFNAGTNVGAIATPFLVFWLMGGLGMSWRMVFVVTGIFGVLWLIAWLAIYRDDPATHPRVEADELAHIQSDPADPDVKTPGLWVRLLAQKETWAFALGKFFIDPVWWFYLFWLPGYLGDRYDLDLTTWTTATAVIALGAIYLISDVGSIAGGWLSGKFISMGMTANKARKLTMLVCAFAVLPVMFATAVDNLWVSVVIIGVAAAAHQGFSANLFTVPSDTYPRFAVGAVIGIGGTLGGIGGALSSKLTGYFLANETYTPLFILAGGAYFAALLCIHLLSPRLERVERFRETTPWAVLVAICAGLVGVILFLASSALTEGPGACYPVWAGPFGDAACLTPPVYWGAIVAFLAVAVAGVLVNALGRRRSGS
ncbi:MFS transporter [Sphingosinithalassobacter sp. LHW66-3]|uniref:MFS transporter n=1 Tax=Sphingosinithalassobacter sp. LHW66-3 TaxID=3424718 RepID=UPI003D6AC8F1